MKINKAYCLFEQSGTYKNEFIKLGIPAKDYDICNDFGETDYQIDLFNEIDRAFDNESSIFDEITPDDVIVAFFPCTRFECKIPLAFRGQTYQQTNWTDEQKLEYSMKLHDELHDLYQRLCKLCLVCIRGGYRMIVENPYTQPHYLTSFFPLKPRIIDKDRQDNGDYYKKPTQFFIIGFEPEDNLVFEPLEYVPTYRHDSVSPQDGKSRAVMRSLMHPQYARRFILRYLTGGENID